MLALTQELAHLRDTIEHLQHDTIMPVAAVEIVTALILTREGDVVCPELAEERARNIVSALYGMRITDGGGR